MCLETARWADPEIEENFEAVIPRLAAAELKLEFLTQMSEPDGLSVSA